MVVSTARYVLTFLFGRVPKFLSFEQQPFTEDTYIEEVAPNTQEGRAQCRLFVNNTVRWRHVVDRDGKQVIDPTTGDPKMESNARFVKWDDGSSSLVIGDEVIDVAEKSIHEGNTHIFMRSKPSLYAETVVTHKYTFAPASSNSLTHKIMKDKMASRYEKSTAIKTIVVSEDPTKTNRDLAKKEDEKNSVKRKLDNKRRKELMKQSKLNSRFLEDGQDDDFSSGSEEDFEQNVRAMKSISGKRRDDYSSDEEAEESRSESGGESDKERRLKNAKRAASDDDNSDSDDGKNKSKKKTRYSDDDDSGSDLFGDD
ncbi:hypothetical protein SARC_03993 [Sphaeroforma arctica JP610]|uniref:RNA polymerase-associated protein LEO1 n=1 Tax=Sphaeroforma arctica JP610 TaxID=667725 RepID=A0A0L0G4F2_9EUKA|nr:hypothetical protein SARC_03993 [Sphaeroforma arctica JP610]KNC83769.1 hypothetical protein SARC_03993 [Sphaeroforma arctica JP610]|eukprot:XP_014157671.1 hypothetical protein SARC_03993 [Sphaeroforma arctica JP610]